MTRLENFACGKWVAPEGEGTPQYNAISGDMIALCGSEGLSFEAMAEYGRNVGNVNLRKMTFQERGMMLKKLALFLNKKRRDYYPVSYQSGATKADSWIDIDGGIGTLFAYASLRKQFPNTPFHVDGELANLSREGTFIGHHIMVPKRGVAVHINAFNFPIWGMLEKCAVNWLAGMPAIVKAAEPTSYLTQAMVKDIIDSGILPEGALQLVCGPGEGILDPLNEQDIVTFTGSATTGRILKSAPNIIHNAIPFNMEADSLNAAVLGEDAVPGTPEFDLFVKEVRKEITTKCGQKCTAIRRIIVPENVVEDFQIALWQQLKKVTIGNPENEKVRMGSLVSKEQVEEVNAKVKELIEECELVIGDPDTSSDVIDAEWSKGAFYSPLVFLNKDPFKKTKVHETEAFGPVSTILPYKDLGEAISLTQMGRGSLVSSISTFDDSIASEFALEAASHHGRILVLNRESAKESTGHGSPMPLLSHGGPGRAGGGEEMGGTRGVKHYLQRCAIQGTPTTLTAITQQYQPGAKVTETPKHPFQYHFEDIRPGMSVTTHKRTVTDTDIINFANLTWDHFYAHTDITSLKGTIFEKRAAHGYFLLSAGAGLFVDPGKGPVGANYGLDECRFIRPIYHNDTIQVRLTCKEKTDRDSRGREFPSGVVKWYEEILDEDGELVAFATILTLVQKKCPFHNVNKAFIQEGLAKLTAEAKPKWGIMTSQHMVEHIEFFHLMSIGKYPTEIATPEKYIERVQDSLFTYEPMPKNHVHPLMEEGKLTELKHANLEEAKDALLTAYDAFEAYFKENPDASMPNTVFGMLDKELWDLLNRKHYHHHFQQFGLIN
ncbi:phenylacetic acid degradation bifunctional protein PaaZ [Fulvivirga sp. M361]|uniref:phenylacetic acid degradation bifunctional protein PaaZ n=1 Tax=Fulvivirga sp. M361 TaxID=2594266 RepID=UPI00117B081F|nr:phenylacetic acid degradation bifunctional protein PaaZ [Fulvivirga sp. M361]TRX48479.1 phenylacetic acid degradation bifunctional protein PaaZ [Fulvivirga sp. M361]